MNITEELFKNKDEEYREFQIKLMPTVNPESVIGIRTPVLRKMAKALCMTEEAAVFMKELPHKYFDENQLQAFLISEIKDYEKCIEALEEFLPYIDNWATCDQTSPKIFKKHKEKLLEQIYKWLNDKHTYTVRFAIGMLMRHFLDEDFKEEYLKSVTEIKTSEYYIQMEIAWYMATALAKQWESAVRFIENKSLDKWTHNKSIQKACESFRVSKEHKEYLKTLKI